MNEEIEAMQKMIGVIQNQLNELQSREEPHVNNVTWLEGLQEGTPILVSDDGIGWFKVLFGSYTGCVIYAANNQSWIYAKPDPEAPSILNWLPNTGVAPDCEFAIAKFEDGKIVDLLAVDSMNWSLKVIEECRIKEYAIIK